MSPRTSPSGRIFSRFKQGDWERRKPCHLSTLLCRKMTRTALILLENTARASSESRHGSPRYRRCSGQRTILRLSKSSLAMWKRKKYWRPEDRQIWWSLIMCLHTSRILMNLWKGFPYCSNRTASWPSNFRTYLIWSRETNLIRSITSIFRIYLWHPSKVYLIQTV